MLSIIGATVAVGLAYWAGLVIYRLFFHPLAHFPGSKLSACSLWYEFYYDVVLRGKFIWQIQKWHEQYGPIIRINPNELHINDSEYLDEVFGSQTRVRNKYEPWVAGANAPGSAFATVSHEHHRARRSVLNPLFSKKAVMDVEYIIQDKAAKLVDRFEQSCGTGQVVRADAAYTAFSMDVLCQYAFGVDDDYLAEDDYKVQWRECVLSGCQALPLIRQFPWLGNFVKRLPDSVAATINPPLATLNEWRASAGRRAQAVLDENPGERKTAGRTIFHTLRDAEVPPEEKTVDRLGDEAQVFMGAGSETTAHALATLTYHLLASPEKLRRLRDELKTVMPDPRDKVSCAVLEQLPYTTAVAAEGLRLSFGVTSRMPRVAPTETLQYGKWTIPRGTPVSTTGFFTLTEPHLFPRPFEFEPTRWLAGDHRTAVHSPLNKYLMIFGRGSRQCIGINLAYAELYLGIAAIFRRFEMELYDTTIEDVEFKHDFIVAHPKLDTKGIRIKIVGMIDD